MLHLTGFGELFYVARFDMLFRTLGVAGCIYTLTLICYSICTHNL